MQEAARPEMREGNEQRADENKHTKSVISALEPVIKRSWSLPGKTKRAREGHKSGTPDLVAASASRCEA